jgi:hypothetical protein
MRAAEPGPIAADTLPASRPERIFSGRAFFRGRKNAAKAHTTF